MIHYVCVATESKNYFPYLKKLIPELVVLGMGMKWKGFIMKYTLLKKYLETVNDNDVVCFIDAYDVLPTKNIVNLEKQFKDFSKKHPEIKMIVGYEKNESKLPDYLADCLADMYFDTVKGYRINSGQFIGYVKNIKHIISSILLNIKKYQTKQSELDDQIELIKYIKEHKSDFFIDKKRHFFNIITTPLEQIKNTNKMCSFIHANVNGLLEDFLLEHHKIDVNQTDRTSNFIDNTTSLCKKIYMYTPKYISSFIEKNRPFASEKNK